MEFNIRSVFLNKYFYLFLIFFVVVFYYIFGSKAFSFSWLGLWSETQNIKISQGYIRKTDFEDISVGSVLANVKLGKGEYNDQYYISSSINLIQTAGTLINIDIVELLDGSSNKSAVLQSHMNQIDQTLEKLSTQGQSLISTINEKKQEAVLCDSAKGQGDSSFFQGLNSNENDMIYEGLQSSLDNGPCYIKARVLSNAYASIYNKLTFYQNVLKAKSDILNINQDLIIQNYQLFKNSYLERLIAIRDELATFKISNPQ